MKHDVLTIHASDHDQCLARLRAEVVDGVDSSGVAALVGTAVHRVAESIALEVAEHPAIDQREIASRVFKQEVRRLAIPPAGVVDGLRILDKVLAFDSRIKLHAEPGWNSRPEVKWALDVDLNPFDWIVDPNTGEGAWRDEDGNPPTLSILAAGTMDLEMWTTGDEAGRLRDYKTIRAFRGPDHAFEDFQLRLYTFAEFIRRPAMQECNTGFSMLRHGYETTADFVRGDEWAWSTETQLRAIRDQRERAVESDEWPETPGPWCKYCPIAHKCVKVEAMRAQGEMPPDLPHAEIINRWKALQALADEYEEAAKAPFQDEHHDAPVLLGDARGTAFGWKDTQAWALVGDYEQTMERLRMLVPDAAWPTVFAENFRFVTEGNLPSRVKKVLGDLRVREDVRDSIVLPLTKPMLTTFRPEIPKPGIAEDATRDVIDAAIDDFLGG